MMAGGKVKTTAVLGVSDRLLSHPASKVPLSSKPPIVPQPHLKSVHFAYSNQLRRSLRVCAIPDRFSKKTESKLSIGTNRSYLDIVDLDIRLNSRPFHELQFDDHKSWSDWLTYIDQIESIEEQLKTMKSELDNYVILNRFSDAARIRSKLDLCEEHDLTLKIRKRLEDAIKNDDFEKAAKLRDEGLTGLNGWWIAREKDDPYGTLIYIHQGFSHYMGRAFTPSEVAMANDQRMPSLLTSQSSQGGEVVQFPGNLVLEVYLKEDENGSILHQPCVLRNPVLASLKETYKNEEGDSTDFEIEYEYDEEGNMEVITMTRIANHEFVDHENSNRENSDGDVTSETTQSQFRVASDIRWWDRNRFVLSIREDVQNANSEDEVSDEPKTPVTSQTRFADSKAAKTRTTTQLQSTVDEILDRLKRRVEDVAKKYGMGHSIQDQSQDYPEDVKSASWESASNLISQLTGEVMFSRLPSDLGSLDPFTGFYIGEFGPHGHELLLLSRHRDEVSDRDFVEARKITGDPNVPTGEVTFWAYIGREARCSYTGRYPEEYGVQAIYNGKGRIADEGFKDPKWVNGELLCFEKWSSMGEGSELGFMWSVPGRRRFLVYLNRVKLQKY